MKKKMRSRKSPLPMASPPSPSPPKSSILNSNKKKKPIASVAAAAGVLRSSPPPSLDKTLASISDLKELASSRFDDIKSRLIDRSHSEIIKDLEASHSRLHKHFKIQSQTCQQMMDESEKDFKKMTERVTETTEAMKETYTEFMAEAQATASRVCKTTIPELAKSLEKSIGDLQSRFGIPSN
ncbi:hypothetical protein POPTR_001G132232v4 [Populus trichocarpa]|uniref:Uncharacterized protein n=2 Tax=Populus trichocarpa TaxID=3694 RepID=A0ACC0TJ07_POPTR|nr:uncharacterized protein LOC18094078 [Populus trichocarpa]XP_024449284.2 uncharacterized protein LOC18094078 [Populus trichocarpa]KAI9401502.1 hypothetical protein POPTR_001G132232v4 [Populus trichocarpa]KAI9401503.1 hypothetical protein POPTR_001G132232v4 [Populus trichocarpa]